MLDAVQLCKPCWCVTPRCTLPCAGGRDRDVGRTCRAFWPDHGVCEHPVPSDSHHPFAHHNHPGGVAHLPAPPSKWRTNIMSAAVCAARLLAFEWWGREHPPLGVHEALAEWPVSVGCSSPSCGHWTGKGGGGASTRSFYWTCEETLWLLIKLTKNYI